MYSPDSNSEREGRKTPNFSWLTILPCPISKSDLNLKTIIPLFAWDWRLHSKFSDEKWEVWHWEEPVEEIKEEIKKYLETNDSEDNMTQNL